MDPYAITNELPYRRVLWFYDEYYETVGSWALDTEEETKAAEEAELEGLRSGRLVVLRAVVQERETTAHEWRERDSVCGFVVSVDADLEELARGSLDLPATEEDVTPQQAQAVLQGLDVSLFRSPIDGRLVVQILTHDLDDSDTYSGGVPDIRIIVNESDSLIRPNGDWLEVSTDQDLPMRGELT